MQIFVKKPEGKTVTLNVESDEMISSVKRKLEEKERIPSDKQTFIYAGKHLHNLCTLADYNIFKDSTLLLVFLPRICVNTVAVVLKSEQEGIPPDSDGNHTLSEMDSTLHPPPRGTIMNPERPQSAPSQLNATSQRPYKLRKRPAPQVAPGQTKIARPATPATPNTRSIIEANDGEVFAEYIQGLATSADRHAMSHNNYDAKLKLFALHQAKATAALSDLMPEFRNRPPPSVLTELEDLKHEMASARSKEKKQEATISGLMQNNKVLSAQCASYKSQIDPLKAENKKTKEKLTVALNKGKKLEATITGLTHKNKTLSGQCASYESEIVALEADGKKTKEVLMVAHDKEKELEATISRLMHKNKVFSAQCASYESQVVALEIENKKTKERLMFAAKKYYSGARAAGYAEGLKEGKANTLKFLHHLTDASVQYFEYGFDSCQKQAEQQGFVGQLNKDSALKEAPELKGWESSVVTE